MSEEVWESREDRMEGHRRDAQRAKGICDCPRCGNTHQRDYGESAVTSDPDTIQERNEKAFATEEIKEARVEVGNLTSVEIASRLNLLFGEMVHRKFPPILVHNLLQEKWGWSCEGQEIEL